MAGISGIARTLFRAVRLPAPPHARSLAPIRAAAYSAAPSSPRQRRVSHILLPPGQESLLEELKTRVQGGEDIAKLAEQLSQCPSAKHGGDLGWLSKGRTAPEFNDVAFTAAVGEVATCVTKFGAHVVVVTGERAEVSVSNISVDELAELLAAGAADPSLMEAYQFIDVREDWEVDLAAIPRFKDAVLSLSAFQQWAPRVTEMFDKDKETLVLCHHGIRSMQAAQFLVESGFTNVRNVSGGIDAYSRVDASVPIY